jgi:hypothetical protein
MLPQLPRFGQYGPPRRFSQEYINGVHCVNILCHDYGGILHEDFSKQKDFINRFLEPVHFTFVESNEHEHEHALRQHIFLKYKSHVPTGQHECDDYGCDDWYIVLTEENAQLLIKYNPFRTVDFTKDDFIRIHTHFARLFNVMRLAVTSGHSMVTLKEYVTRTPRWCERMRTNIDAVDLDRFPYALFSPLFSGRRFYHQKKETHATLLGKRLLTKVKEDKMQRKQAIVRKVQNDIHMRAIPHILLMVPMGVNPYSEYINRFICNMDLYEMMYQSKYGIPVINTVDVSTASTVYQSLDPTESEQSFMSFFSRDSENSMFCIVARRTRLEDPELDTLFNTHSKEAQCKSMKKVFEMFFFGRNLAVHLDRINQLTVYDSCHLTEETFTDLFDVYINVFMFYTKFSYLSDTNVIHLAYLAEFMGDTHMVYRIIDYFLGFRLEYLYRIWKADIPPINTDFTMPVFFKRFQETDVMLHGPDYGWDENGRDA